LKDYTQTLLSLAEIDSKMADLAMPTWPHQAAFHAQQCAEKSIKAAAFEFGPFESEPQFRPIAKKKIGHASTVACMEVMRVSIKAALNGAYAEQDRVHDDAAKRGLASLAAYKSTKFISRRIVGGILKDFDKTMREYSKRRDRKYWKKSFTETFVDPSGPVTKLPEKLPLSQKALLWVFRKSGKSVGIDEATSSLFKEGADWGNMDFSFLDDWAKSLRSSGRDDIAVTAERTRDLVNGVIGPTREMFSWIQLVLRTVPFTDAHAVIARYPSEAQLERYRANVEGVERLVTRSKLVLSETRKLVNAKWLGPHVE